MHAKGAHPGDCHHLASKTYRAKHSGLTYYSSEARNCWLALRPWILLAKRLPGVYSAVAPRGRPAKSFSAEDFFAGVHYRFQCQQCRRSSCRPTAQRRGCALRRLLACGTAALRAHLVQAMLA